MTSSRTRKSAKTAGTRFERQIADALAAPSFRRLERLYVSSAGKEPIEVEDLLDDQDSHAQCHTVAQPGRIASRRTSDRASQ